MKYPLKAANGHAGEYFFAYQIAWTLKWPCRLIDVDIGIDAQVEVLNEDSTSTGRFVAFQIKASNDDEPDSRYVSHDQLSYWRELGLPVFVVLVELKQRAMFLHRVSLDIDYHETSNGTIRIDFDRTKDQFTEESGILIASAASEPLTHLNEHLADLERGIQNIRRAIDGQESFPDSGALIEAMRSRDAVREKLAQTRSVVDALRVDDTAVEKLDAAFEQALEDLTDYITLSFLADHETPAGDIRRFLDEQRY
jgi:hypothetical protein